MKFNNLILIALSFILSGCYEGYIGKKGELLIQYLKPEALKALTENPKENIWIIDVRPSSAYKRGHIPGAKSFPSSTIIGQLHELPKDTFMIFYCETGGRAQQVIKHLEEKGYTRIMNWGSYKKWKWELES